MAWIYLAALEESPWPYRHGLHQSPIVKTTDTPNLFCFREWQGANCPLRQSGTMSKPCEENFCRKSMSFTAAFHARISALRGLAAAWKVGAQSYSMKSLAWLGNYDLASSSWKMLQPSLFEGLMTYSERLPSSGMTVGGKLIELQTSERHTIEQDGGYWPTPTARDYKPPAHKRQLEKYHTERRGIPLSIFFKEKFGTNLTPNFVEYLMGYRQSHSALSALGMQWYRSKREKRSKN